jgi:hypothetical protein
LYPAQKDLLEQSGQRDHRDQLALTAQLRVLQALKDLLVLLARMVLPALTAL